MEKQPGGPGDAPPVYGGPEGGQATPLYPRQNQPDQQGPPGPPPPQATTVFVTPFANVLPTMPFGMQCPNCHAQITTEIALINGLLVWLCILGLCVFGFVLGCCLIPLCIDDLKDVEHRCPQCHAFIGLRKRI